MQTTDLKSVTNTTPLSELDGMADDDLVFVACGKCSGDGVVHYGRVEWHQRIEGGYAEDRWCFKCNGRRGERVTVRKMRQRIKDKARRDRKAQEELQRKAAQARIEQERAAADLKQKIAAFRIEHPVECAFLYTLQGDFARSLLEQLHQTGSLTQGQVDALGRMIDERSREPEAAPVVEGKQRITGAVKSTKVVENDYGSTLKMLVLDDRGFKVWGTMPRALDVSKGDRVAFNANVEASQDDETFGFFKRPTKPEQL